MGITSPLDAIPSIGLGALRLGVSPLEMAHAYATLANGGARVGGSVEFRESPRGELADPSADPISITKVIGANGKVIANNTPIVRQVISRENALEIDAILDSVIRYGTAKIIKGFPRPPSARPGRPRTSSTPGSSARRRSSRRPSGWATSSTRRRC